MSEELKNFEDALLSEKLDALEKKFLQEKFDLIKPVEREISSLEFATKIVNPESLCICDSGKKFKDCCKL